MELPTRARAMKILRHTSPQFAMFAIGVAFGLFWLGIQIPSACIVGPETSATCMALHRADKLATTAALSGFGLLVGAMALDYYLEEGE